VTTTAGTVVEVLLKMQSLIMHTAEELMPVKLTHEPPMLPMPELNSSSTPVPPVMAIPLSELPVIRQLFICREVAAAVIADAIVVKVQLVIRGIKLGITLAPGMTIPLLILPVTVEAKSTLVTSIAPEINVAVIALPDVVMVPLYTVNMLAPTPTMPLPVPVISRR